MTDNVSLDTASQVLSALLVTLSQSLPFVILRNYEGLPDAWSNDVDILVYPKDICVARKITLGILGQSPYANTTRIMERLNFWSVRLSCADRILQIDFYTAMSKAWVTYADADSILAARVQRHPIFCVPDPLHELLLIAAKELFSYGYIRDRYQGKLAINDNGNIEICARLLFSKHITESGCSLIRSALSDPTVKGRPRTRISSILKLRAILNWMALRSNGWKPMPHPSTIQDNGA